MEDIKLGSQIKKLREHLHLTQGDFSRRMKKSQAQISNIEKNSTNPDYNFVKKVIKEYHVNPMFLFFNHLPILIDEHVKPQDIQTHKITKIQNGYLVGEGADATYYDSADLLLEELFKLSECLYIETRNIIQEQENDN